MKGIFTPGIIGKAAAGGDPAAQFILARAGRALGVAIGALTNIFNPQLVVIGGGVAAVGAPLLGPAKDAIPSYSFQAMRDDLTIVTARLGDDGGLFGAAALALDTGS